jgi:hypothetical protein
MKQIATVASINLLLLCMPGLALGQGTIISVSGPPDTSGQYSPRLEIGDFLAGISWIASDAFSNVNISINLNADPGATAMAYLTTSIGPGTTINDEIASGSFGFPSTSSLVSVLSGLYLQAGTYYLIIEGTASGNNGDGIWQGTPAPTLSSNPTVIANREYFYENSISGYPPAADQFSYSTALVPNFEFTITGTPIPEPSTLSLIFLGSGVLIYVRTRKRFNMK